MEEFLNILSTSILSILGALVAWAAKEAVEWIKENKIDKKIQTRSGVAKAAVMMVEQTWKELDGTEKFEKAKDAFIKELAVNKIKVDEDEINLFIESAVREVKGGLLEAGLIEEESNLTNGTVDSAKVDIKNLKEG